MAPDLDLLELEHRARGRGLPPAVAATVARVAGLAGLDLVRRDEVFEELVAHFEDGLAAGRAAEALLAEFGDPARTTTLVAESARIARSPDSTLPAARRFPVVPLILRELRFASRRLLKSPGFSAIAILTLALGIGAMTSMFSVINAVVLRPWPIAGVEEVYDLFERIGGGTQPLTNPDLRDFERATTDAFAAVAGVRYARAQAGEGAETAPVAVELVTGSYFGIVGLPPALGRLLGPEDDLAPGGHPVVVLGHRYWVRNFHADPGVVGRSIRLNGRPYSIIGVAAAEYQGNVRALRPDVTASMMMVNILSPSETDLLESREAHGMFGKARVRAGVTEARANGAADRAAADLRLRRVGSWESETAAFRLIPTKNTILFPDADPYLRRLSGLLLGVMGLLLLVICANLAGFLLARGIDRRREIAVQLAIGATRGRVLLALMMESLLLGSVGGVGGLAMTAVFARLLANIELPLPIPVALDAAPDLWVFGFGAVVALASGLVFGLAPALKATAPDLITALRDESAGGGGRGRSRLRNGLVIGQVAACLVLLITTGLLIRGVQSLRRVDPGFGQRPTAVVAVTFPVNRYPVEQRLTAIREVAARFGRLGGVVGVGVIDNIHLNLMNTQTASVRNPEDNGAAERVSLDADRAAVDTGFFAAAGIEFVRGRDFRADDGGTARVAIVNEALAARLWPGQDPIGRRLMQDQLVEVVGLVRTAKIRSLTEPPRPVIYTPLAGQRAAAVWYLLRTSGDADLTAGAALAALKSFDRELIPTSVTTAARHIGTTMLPVRLGAMLLSGLAAVAMILAVVGLYGTVSYAVAQRNREVGIRLALGASPSTVVRMLAVDGLKLVGWGAGIGLLLAGVVALGLRRVLAGAGFDAVIFLTVPLGLALVVGLAAWLPARRAGKVAPAMALRSGE